MTINDSLDQYEEWLEKVSPIIETMVESLEKLFPGIKEKKYSEDCLAGNNLFNRLIFGLYLEFIRMGNIK